MPQHRWEKNSRAMHKRWADMDSNSDDSCDHPLAYSFDFGRSLNYDDNSERATSSRFVQPPLHAPGDEQCQSRCQVSVAATSHPAAFLAVCQHFSCTKFTALTFCHSQIVLQACFWFLLWDARCLQKLLSFAYHWDFAYACCSSNLLLCISVEGYVHTCILLIEFPLW